MERFRYERLQRKLGFPFSTTSTAVFSIPKTARPEKKDRPEGGPLLD
jgi:hypothetical protein